MLPPSQPVTRTSRWLSERRRLKRSQSPPCSLSTVPCPCTFPVPTSRCLAQSVQSLGSRSSGLSGNSQIKSLKNKSLLWAGNGHSIFWTPIPQSPSWPVKPHLHPVCSGSLRAVWQTCRDVVSWSLPSSANKLKRKCITQRPSALACQTSHVCCSASILWI